MGEWEGGGDSGSCSASSPYRVDQVFSFIQTQNEFGGLATRCTHSKRSLTEPLAAGPTERFERA